MADCQNGPISIHIMQIQEWESYLVLLQKSFYTWVSKINTVQCALLQKGNKLNHQTISVSKTGVDHSSTSMEADIIATGFRLSETMHGVRYTQVIGDGDSSVFYTIQTTVPSYGRDVAKIECANHATSATAAD